MNNFWKQLPAPFTALAPMDGVTDFVFRQIIAEIGRPSVFFTEFTNCDSIMSTGRDVVTRNLMFNDSQKPIVAQIWGSTPLNFYNTAKYIKKLGLSGIDINMGCPDKVVIKNNAGAALINQPDLAGEIIKATKKGAGNLPVSVKTRIGFETPQINDWIGFLLKQNLAALAIHLRTFSELSKVPAHWELMSRIIKLRNKLAPDTLIIGNGDITSLKEVEEKYKEYGCEGYMIGTGIFSNPWVFNKSVNVNNITVADKQKIYLRHIRLFVKTWGNTRNSANLKKYCKMYINNFPNAVDMREKIMKAKTAQEIEEILTSV
ncbi:MAG: tRNA-dihydrouridine synthase [Candidatus Levybacteria bacterium]|nr:tRNA-dihydrouridine synthase [Candidatus Levybacteria bacterium]